MAEQLTPEDVDGDEPIKQRKNGLYPAVSDELAEAMKSGWADTELHDLAPIAAGRAHRPAPRRAVRALPRRATGDPGRQPQDPVQRHRVPLPRRRVGVRLPHRRPDRRTRVLVLEPAADGHKATALPAAPLRPGERRVLAGRPGRAVGRPPQQPRRGPSSCSASRAPTCASSPTALREATGPVRVVRGYDAAIEAALTDKVTAERDEELRDLPLRAAPGQGRVRDRRAAEGLRLHRPRLRGRREGPRQGRGHLASATSRAPSSCAPASRATTSATARICAAGPHATTLHWVRNDGPVRSGDLLLLDAGVETHHPLHRGRHPHAADRRHASPTLQRKIYDAVYEAQEAGIAAVQPGREVPRLPRRGPAGAGREAGGVGPASRDRWSGCWSWACSAAGRCTAPATCSASTSTTAPHARTEAYVDCTLEPGMVPHRRAGSVLPGRRPDGARRSTAASACASRTTSWSPPTATGTCRPGCRGAPTRSRPGCGRCAAEAVETPRGTGPEPDDRPARGGRGLGSRGGAPRRPHGAVHP